MAKAKIQKQNKSKSKSKSGPGANGRAHARAALKRREALAVKDIKKAVQTHKKSAIQIYNESESRLIKTYLSRCIPEAEPLQMDQLNDFSATYAEDPVNAATENALSSVPASWLAEKRNVMQSLDYAYSHLPELCPRPTQQAYSGRCWLFASLNTIRHHLIHNFNLNDQFELSEAYLFFYDKIERSLFFLENMIKFRDTSIHDIRVNGMTTYFSPVTDGGTWSFFINLITKYGIVPKTVYGETFNSSDTTDMNDVLWNKLGQFAVRIRSAGASVSNEELQNLVRTEFMPEIYTLMVKFMGEPPQQFDWCYHERASTFESGRQRGPYCAVRDLTPVSFYLKYIEADMSLQNKVVLRHDPRQSSEYYRTYNVGDFGAMVGGKPDTVLNVPWEVLSKAAATAIKDGQQLWFAADVGKCMSVEYGALTAEGFDYDTLLNTNFDLDKGQSLDIHTSFPSHAMALVGVDLEDNDPTRPLKWKVENSWGETSGGPEPGYLLMTDQWFRRYGYEVVVDIGYLDDKTREALDKYEFNPILLPYNDAFGAVARSNCKCRHT